MPKGSQSYRHLVSRLGQLRKHLLPFLPDPPLPPLSRLSYTNAEFDSTRAYVVLSHAEIEAYCEELALRKAQGAKVQFDTNGVVQPVLRRMVGYYVARNGKSWDNVAAPPPDVVASATESFKSVVRGNHGVKINNLEKLFFPLGICDRHLVRLQTWLAQMNSFGERRGSFAHSSIGVQQQPDPLSQLTTVNQLLNGLEELDRIFGRLR